MTAVVARAPASSANLGPGFDCAAAALDLWNELLVERCDNGGPQVEVEGEGAAEVPRDAENVALRAFALFAPVEKYRFRFRNRIPIERGLGASAAAVATGLVAGAKVAGRELAPDTALALGAGLEGHGDNLAAALHGGVCLSWTSARGARATRLAVDLPLAPVLVVPAERTNTANSRRDLPATIGHQDAVAAAARAALLGAAITAGDAALLGEAFDDRLHEPYRAHTAPLLVELKRSLPDGAAGVTLSGSGPSVVVWAEKPRAEAVAIVLRERVSHDMRVLPLQVAREGAVAS